MATFPVPAFAVTVFLLRAFAQDATSSAAGNEAFEVASIRPAEPSNWASLKRSGDRLVISNMSLAMLIEWAYDIRNDRLFNKPDWLESVRYDILAKASSEKRIPGQLQRMMQSLLASRFNLNIHRETRDLPLYVMVVDKNGAKVHPVETGEGIGQSPFNMPGRGCLAGNKVTAELLAKVLSDQVRRTVQDQTGLKGTFDFTLEWEPDTEAPAAEVQTKPSIFTALREQLGLKLEPRKGPVEVIVIDHIESTPTEN